MTSASTYRGRFAPTPSGPLHLGSLLTALASFLEARRHRGAWLLRIDDLDAPRCPPGTAATILRQLEEHGLAWDEPPRVQSACRGEYADALAALEAQRCVYACTCTRELLRSRARPGPDGPVYPGTCRDAARGGRATRRLRVARETLCFEDAWQGRCCRELEAEVGDFVVRRADGTPAYQLACAVDEPAQRITHVVRGADLLGSTFQQLWVQQRLGLPRASYGHLPVVTDARGLKLSKQNHAAPIEARRAGENLWRCLRLLGQAPAAGLARAGAAEVLHWALSHWDAAKVPRGAAQTEGLPL